MADRALAYITTVDEIRPLDGYDRVEYVRTKGWWCVCQKGMKVGDKAVYFEIDSLLPMGDHRFAFMEKCKWRVKTQRMCKVISQGLLMPITEFPDLADLPVGTDLTQELHVKYYVPEDNTRKATVDPNAKYKSMAARHRKLFSTPVFRWLMRREWGKKLLFKFFGKKRSDDKAFPTKFAWVHKTDENRIELINDIIDRKVPYIVTTKIDGCMSYRMPVETNIGALPIGKIVNEKLDVLVRSYNQTTGLISYNKILAYHKYKRDRDMYRIYIGARGYGHSNKEKYIECTDNHQLLTKAGWKEAKDIKPDDIVYHYSDVYPYEIKQLILGSLLGDACISNNTESGNYRSVYFTQSEKQIDYFNYKKQFLGKYAIGERTRVSGYGSLMHDIHTPTNLELSDYLNKNCLRNNKKTVTNEWAYDIDPLGLAFWYMDDGSLSNRETTLKCRIHLNTQGFSIEEIKILCDMLKNKFNISTTIGNKDTYKGYVIIIDAANTERFCSLIAPYICDSMKYKLPAYYEGFPCVYANANFDVVGGLVESRVKDVQNITEIINTRKGDTDSYVYDLTVENDSTYFVHNILVHNTSSTYILERVKTIFGNRYEYYVCSRNVRQLNEDQDCYHDTNVYWEMSNKYHLRSVLQDILDRHPEWDYVCLQGETAGPDVQGNPHKLKERQLFGFNFIDSEHGRWDSVKARDLMAFYNVPWVPIVDTYYMIPDTLEEFKLAADGPCEVPGSSGMREGYVYRKKDDPNVSFKNVSNEYLLKH